MAWWAHAISHHINPFMTSVIWAPSGVNLAWTANMPLAAWLVYPVTRGCGPMVSYNLLCLLSPALAGWSAFALCRYVVREWWPAMFGGLIFAFSPYVLSRMLGNMDLTLVWPIPLAVYVTLRRIDDNFGVPRLRGTARDAGCRAVFAVRRDRRERNFVWRDRAFAGGARDGAAGAPAPVRDRGADRRRLRRRGDCRLTVPLLHVRLPDCAGEIFSPWHFAIDLASLVVPTAVNQLGGIPFFLPITHQFRAELAETGAYLGLPMLAIVILFARERWHAPGGDSSSACSS